MAKQNSSDKVYSAYGIDIYFVNKPAKKVGGKNHVWVQIRQKDKKDWQVYTTLAYRNSVDIHLIK